jgi:hypothetical protein
MSPPQRKELLIFFLVGLVFEFTLAKQLLYYLSYTSSAFPSDYFGRWRLKNSLPRLAPNLDPPNFILESS